MTSNRNIVREYCGKCTKQIYIGQSAIVWSCGVSYVPRLAKVVNVLAIRQVKQGTETTGFRIGFTLHSCQYVSS